MRRARFVEGEIRLERVRSHLFRDKVMQHQDVGLLQHLRTKGALVPKQQVRGDGAMNELGDYKWFQPIEARELLERTGGQHITIIHED